ncbi:hypothetical protein [Streptomyces humi]|uniref:MmyB family transcriptional regulator n=1 Tax=Streptomyces humi TaxID=1428620 RepID=UPI0006288A09|nr:hypothetical protein [Streptomyces humi]
MRVHHGGVKRFHHPAVGAPELAYRPLDLPVSALEAHSPTIYTAQPGTPDADRLQLLAGWTATGTAHQNDGAGRAPSTCPQAPRGSQGCCPPWVRRTWVRLARFATPSFR